MRLEQIKISNFKGIRSGEFSPTSFACLVGENNAGKSTVLQAVVYSLTRPTQLPVELFYDPNVPVVFTVEFSSINDADLLRLAEEHRSKISELIVAGMLTIVVTYPPNGKCEVTALRRMPTEVRYRPDSITEVLKGKAGAAVRQAVLAEFPEFSEGLPDALNITSAKEFLGLKIGALADDQYSLVEGPLPSGISTSITKLLPEPIYIPAVKNLGDELKTTQSASFGKLIGLLLDGMVPDLGDINRSLDLLDSLFNRVKVGEDLVDERHEKVRSLEGSIEGFLAENFPSARVELNVPRPELKTILSAAQIFVDDGSKDLIDNKGDGIKRSLTFALLQAYVAHLGAEVPEGVEGQPSPRPLMFLFEEPELYLHPKSQKVLFRTLARISERHQVVVTTHSPLFFEPGVTASFVRVAKEAAEPKPSGVLFPIKFDLDLDNAETFRLTKFENADAAFFSRGVVLFEGESDDAFCRHVARALNPEWDFDAKNISLVRVSGKGNFAKYRKFFEAFGIQVKIVADLDALFDGFAHLGASAEVLALRSQVLQQIDAMIVELGIRAEPLPRQIKDKVQQEGWSQKWEFAKAVVRDIQAGVQPDAEALIRLGQLFDWEQDIARIRACRDHAVCRQAIVGLLDQLRGLGICVLSKGAIEDYYPEGAPLTGAKPARALAACALVNDVAVATSLSTPLVADRPPELLEIFGRIFT